MSFYVFFEIWPFHRFIYPGNSIQFTKTMLLFFNCSNSDNEELFLYNRFANLYGNKKKFFNFTLIITLINSTRHPNLNKNVLFTILN